ncbi:MAG: tRNA pseudouridine(55) synthase TruB [Thermoanaerobaculia bacterium]
MTRSGLLLIDKEPGCTSHDVVQRARRALRQRKIGHCGTLDPEATGLLVLTLGKATRLTRFLINAPKTYSGTIRFGISTDTYDVSGQVTEQRPIASLTDNSVRTAIAAMVGTMDQAAPPFSAKKIKGVKYYELARRGEEVPTALKSIDVFDFSADGVLAGGRQEFTLSCSTGTYVRSIAHDLGESLGCGAHLESLRRLKVGPFSVESARPMDRIAKAAEGAAEGPEDPDLGSAWIRFDEIPLPFPELKADAQEERRISNGQTVLLRGTPSAEGDWIKLVNQRSQLIAVGSVIETIGEGGVGVVRPRIVFR